MRLYVVNENDKIREGLADVLDSNGYNVDPGSVLFRGEVVRIPPKPLFS